MADSWRIPFTQEFPNLKSYHVIPLFTYFTHNDNNLQMMVLDNPGYRLLGPMIQIGLRNTLDKSRYPFFGVHYAPIAYFSTLY